MSIPNPKLNISGERIQVEYVLTGTEKEARDKAEDICIEQTIEFPIELVPDGDIKREVLGRIESFENRDSDHWRAIISFATEVSGEELPQIINLIFGNISIKPGIRLERLKLPTSLLNKFRGPRFGQEGVRQLLNVPKRPLLCTVLKPIGLTNEDLAKQAYQFALGGIDIIKDDHSLANQPLNPFKDRVERCGEAVAKANKETGEKCIYMPVLNTPADNLKERAKFAKRAGAGGFLVFPGIMGYDTMRHLANDDEIALPLMSHPTLLGGHVVNPENGISHYTLFGTLARLAGSDCTIFPDYRGRFSFTREQCLEIVEGASAMMGRIKPIFPTAAAGLTEERAESLLADYGKNVIFMIGGGLHRMGDDLAANAKKLRNLISS